MDNNTHKVKPRINMRFSVDITLPIIGVKDNCYLIRITANGIAQSHFLRE